MADCEKGDQVNQRLRKRKWPELVPTDPLPVEKKAPKSGAQRAREHYGRMKEQNSDKYAQKLMRQKETNRKRQECMKANTTEEQKELEREKHRIRVRKWREKKQLEATAAPKNKGPLRMTRQETEKAELRKKKDRERKQRERADWSSQKKTAERKKARDRYWSKEQKEDKPAEVTTGGHTNARTYEARRQAVHRLKKSLPRSEAAKQETIGDFLCSVSLPSTNISLSTTAVLLSSTGTLEEDVKFKRIMAKKLHYAPKNAANALRKELGIKTNHVKSKLTKNTTQLRTAPAKFGANIKKVAIFFNDVARILPSKKGAARTAQRVLDRSLKELFIEFSRTNEGISFSFFAKHRPKHVKTHGFTKFNQALCEIGENLQLKLKALNCKEVGTKVSGVLDKIMCPKQGQHHQMGCINGKCTECVQEVLKKVVKGDVREVVELRLWKMKEVEKDGKKESSCLPANYKGRCFGRINGSIGEL